MLEELLTLNLFGFILIFARIGTTFMLLPGFSAIYVPQRLRLVTGLAITFVLTPVLVPDLPVMPATVPALFLLILGEVLVGAFLGFLSRILLAALHSAGTFIAFFSSMANALIQDPIAEQQSSVIANFLTSLGVILIFVTDTHHLMLMAVVDSYTLFAPGAALAVGDVSATMARRVAESFALGLQLAAPFVLVALTYYIGLGLLGRLMPQLPVFFFGMPFQIGAQIWVLMLTTSGIMLVFLDRFREGTARSWRPEPSPTRESRWQRKTTHKKPRTRRTENWARPGKRARSPSPRRSRAGSFCSAGPWASSSWRRG